jgi:5-methylcytosine-specific restriction endonuclease McrA
MSVRNAYKRRRYAEDRAWAVALLGGSCVDCKVESDLQFDHINAKEKTQEIGPMFGNNSRSRILEELNKCVLRCFSCHKEKSIRSGDNPTNPHGGGLAGKDKCKCDPCRLKLNEYARNRRKMLKLRGIL